MRILLTRFRQVPGSMAGDVSTRFAMPVQNTMPGSVTFVSEMRSFFDTPQVRKLPCARAWPL